MRRLLNALDTVEATELLVDRLRHTRANQEFLQIVEKDLRRNAF
jgi:transcription termination factor Rho